jgi:hypothetical protein
VQIPVPHFDFVPWTVRGEIQLDEGELSSFVERNREHWAEFMAPVQEDSHGKLLLDLRTYNLEGIQTICTFANYVARERRLEPMYLVDEAKPKKTELLQSYYPGEVVTTGHMGLSFQIPHALANGPQSLASSVQRFVSGCRSIDDVSDLIDYSVDGIPVGDLVYNSVSRATGEGTYPSMNLRLYSELYHAHLIYEQWRPIFETYDVQAITDVHLPYVWRGMTSRIAVANGCEVYGIWGGKGIIRQYQSPDQANEHWNRFDLDFFECILDEHREQAIERAHRTLADRFGITPAETSVGNSVEVTRSTTDLLAEHSLPAENPTALILPKIFIENLRYEPLFQDHLVWFRELVRLAANHDDVNWVIKPHPNREFYAETSKQNVFDEVDSIVGDRDTTVRILPDETEIPDIVDTVDAVTTVDGTGGIEYSCFGIPAVLAGTSGYSHLGFTHNPDTRDRYLDALANVGELSPLDETKRTRAKVACYLHLDLIWGTLPEHEDEVDSEYDRVMRFLQRANSTEDPFYRNVKRFVRDDHRQLFPADEVSC